MWDLLAILSLTLKKPLLLRWLEVKNGRQSTKIDLSQIQLNLLKFYIQEHFVILSHGKLWQIEKMTFDLRGQGDHKYQNQLKPTFLEFGSGDS